MAIVTLEEMKAELRVLFDDDDDIIADKIDEAQAWIEAFLGYAIAEEFDTVPAELITAVKMQAAHLYENREATSAGVAIQLVPNGVDDILRERRAYTYE